MTLYGVGEGDVGSFLLGFGFVGLKTYYYEINVDRWIRFYTLPSPPPSPGFPTKYFCVHSSVGQWMRSEAVICAWQHKMWSCY